MQNKLMKYAGIALEIGNNLKKTMLNKPAHHKTKLTGEDIDTKHDIIDHVHLEHRHELAYAVKAFTDVNMTEHVLPVIDDMFDEGVQVGFIPTGMSADNANHLQTAEQIQQHANYKTVFIPFRFTTANFEERLFYLIYESAIRIGKSLDNSTKRYFEVIGTSFPSPNMLRIHIKSELPLPKDSPGFAFSLVLNRMNADDRDNDTSNSLPPVIEDVWNKGQNIALIKATSDRLINAIKQSGLTDKIYKQTYLTIFEVFKLLPATQRQKVQRQSGKYQMRYYTLRQAFTDLNNISSNKAELNLGYIDVFIHGDTPASNWAKSLQIGDIISSNRDVEETTEQLQHGQSLLICDESAMPTVALCLETWQSHTVPLVICINHSSSEQAYWDTVNYADTLPKNFKPTFIALDKVAALNTDTYAEKVIAQIENFTQKTGKPIEQAWGALESGQARKIKKHLRETYGLKGRANAVRGYWKNL